MKTLIEINHTSHVNSFLLQAAFSAITVALAFFLDDVLDIAIDNSTFGESNKYIKASIHCVVIFILTLSVIYLFRFLFGWGDTFLGCPCIKKKK
jgi:hypothetical protein